MAWAGSRKSYAARSRYSARTLKGSGVSGALRETARAQGRGRGRTRGSARPSAQTQAREGLLTRFRNRFMPLISITRRNRKVGQGNGGTRDYLWKRTVLRRYKLRPNLNIPYQVDRLQGVKSENVTADYTAVDGSAGFPGYYVINKGASAGTGGLDVPVYNIDLTAFNNLASGQGNVVVRSRIADDGTVSFTNLQTQTFNLANQSSVWTTEQVRGMLIQTAPNAEYVQHMWYSIALKLYGARGQAVTYDCMLVKFRKEHFCFDSLPSNANEANEKTQFWQSLAKPMICNTILPGDPTWLRHVRILKRQRVKLACRDTDDASVVPPSVDLKWFIRDSKIRAYKEFVNTHGSDTAVDSAAWTILGGANTTNQPRNRSRLFLIIRATDMSATATGDDADNSPSFDMCIRRKSRVYP